MANNISEILDQVRNMIDSSSKQQFAMMDMMRKKKQQSIILKKALKNGMANELFKAEDIADIQQMQDFDPETGLLALNQLHKDTELKNKAKDQAMQEDMYSRNKANDERQRNKDNNPTPIGVNLKGSYYSVKRIDAKGNQIIENKKYNKGKDGLYYNENGDLLDASVTDLIDADIKTQAAEDRAKESHQIQREEHNIRMENAKNSMYRGDSVYKFNYATGQGGYIQKKDDGSAVMITADGMNIPVNPDDALLYTDHPMSFQPKKSKESIYKEKLEANNISRKTFKQRFVLENAYLISDTDEREAVKSGTRKPEEFYDKVWDTRYKMLSEQERKNDPYILENNKILTQGKRLPKIAQAIPGSREFEILKFNYINDSIKYAKEENPNYGPENIKRFLGITYAKDPDELAADAIRFYEAREQYKKDQILGKKPK